MLFHFPLPAIFHSPRFPGLNRALQSLFSSAELPFPAAAMAPSKPGRAKSIPPAHQRKILEPQTGAELNPAINAGQLGEAGAAPAPSAEPREPAGVTWRGRQRLCQCWGHSLTCLHSPHWGAALQSTRRMLQMQRLQKAVKNKQHFLFYFVSATTASRSMQ